MGSKKLKITCPCCDAALHIDQKTGDVLWKEEKKKEYSSLSDMVKGLNAQQRENEATFNRQNVLQKDRSRLLDEKFKEAKKHVDKSDTKPLRDFDLD